MAKLKYDGVIEAVRYRTEGKVDWVRAYLRRGPIFSDHVLLQRQSLIDLIKQGKQFVTGSRVQFYASTFKVSDPVRVLEKNGKFYLVTGGDAPDQDSLPGVPQI